MNIRKLGFSSSRISSLNLTPQVAFYTEHVLIIYNCYYDR